MGWDQKLSRVFSVWLFAIAILVAGCGKKASSGDESGQTNPESPVCVQGNLETVAGASGEAFAFVPDPMNSSQNPSLSPSSSHLDEARQRVLLSNLGGRGVLEGSFVDIRDGLSCQEGFGAFSIDNSFLYSHSDPHFQEAMTYYFGDKYRDRLNSVGQLSPKAPVKIIAHCMKDDNAFYVRATDSTGAKIEKVCIGDSVASPGASYADDAMVVLHELQHATTVNTYSVDENLNQFYYDEAGALNEAISDYLTLSYFAPDTVTPLFDPRVFSRWALGTFMPFMSTTRGAHRCPMYDADFPHCGNYAPGHAGFSSTKNILSFNYPDGIGWPYQKKYSGPAYLQAAYMQYRGKEEIHNASLVMTSALWEVYDRIKDNHQTPAAAWDLMAKLVHESLRHLPMPSNQSRSPVTYRRFAKLMTDWALEVGMTEHDRTDMINVFVQRGLMGGVEIKNWAAVGPGKFVSGVRVMDNPEVLSRWASSFGADPSVIKQGRQTGMNNEIDPGETVVIWFDIQNLSEWTVGGVQLTMTVDHPHVKVMGGTFNFYAPSVQTAQIIYAKVNGAGIVKQLTSPDLTYDVPMGNSYFRTNPFFDETPATGIWIQVDEAIQKKDLVFKVRIEPTNADAVDLDFPVTVR